MLATTRTTHGARSLARDLLERIEARRAATWTPNPGPQTAFMASDAFECLYGGAAGGGKSEALLQRALRGVGDGRYTAILFRRSFPDLERSLVARSRVAYPRAHPTAEYNEAKKVWTFPSGARIYFGHLEHDKSVQDHQSAEYQFIGFDELTHFTEWQYTYLLSRARSSFGAKPVIRAATNPGGPGHDWVLRRWGPWLDPRYNGPHAEPGQVLRYSSGREGEQWAAEGRLSRQFIPARLTDTPQLAGTGYDEQLGALDPVTRAQLLDGDWTVRPAGGLYFRRDWFTLIDAGQVPRGARRIRAWDLAATEPHDGNRDPDWTVGVKVAEHNGTFYIEDVARMRGAPGAVERFIQATAEADTTATRIRLPQDPGAAGKSVAAAYVRLLTGFSVRTKPVTGDKVMRASPVSAQASPQSTGGPRGRFCIVRAPWNDAFLSTLEGFPDAKHDDDVDALADAFDELNANQGRRREYGDGDYSYS